MDAFVTFGLKPLLLFIVGYLYLRIGGKKSVSEMNGFDLLFIIVLGAIISGPLITNKPFAAILYGAVFLAAYVLFTYAALNNKLRWLLIAPPTVLLRNGDIDEKGLRKEKMTTSELIGILRNKGFVKTADVELAMMEDTGQISVIPKAHVRPMQPGDINLHPSPTFIPIPIIINGQLINHNIEYLKKDEDWLNMQLKAYQRNIYTISDITLATYSQNGTLAIDTENPNKNSHIGNPNLYRPGPDDLG